MLLRYQKVNRLNLIIEKQKGKRTELFCYSFFYFARDKTFSFHAQKLNHKAHQGGTKTTKALL